MGIPARLPEGVAGYKGLRRNVANALGNWLAGSDTPDPEAIGELVAALSDEDEVVAEAAAWGLGRVRGATTSCARGAVWILRRRVGAGSRQQ